MSTTQLITELTQLVAELITQQNLLETKLEQAAQLQLDIFQEIKQCKFRIEKIEIERDRKMVSEIPKPWKRK